MSLRPSNEAERIKAEAQRLGFFACGIAKAEPVAEEVAVAFRSWLKKGHEADMAYMRQYTDMRLDPRLVMPGAKSVICVAMNYAPQRSMPDEEYQFAAYALGKDYHDLMKERLKQLAAFMGLEDALHSERTSGIYRAFSDTGPILERYWAQRSGLGWIGRNHQLIIPHAGSMFFLGELLVDVELPSDAPMPNRCGKCRRCVEACPTQAILPRNAAVSAYLTDTEFRAGDCLSYQLIENRGMLSEKAAGAMGSVIYGCDICQKVCPWNKFARPTEEASFQPSEELLRMRREDWQQLTVEQYRTLFKGSAVKRAKYEGLMRNIRAAQKNAQEKQRRNCSEPDTPDTV